MPAPVVTVLLPARNAESTVARAVDSLLEGTLALSQATSPYVARLDADDEALPRRLEASVVALEAASHLAQVRS